MLSTNDIPSNPAGCLRIRHYRRFPRLRWSAVGAALAARATATVMTSHGRCQHPCSSPACILANLILDGAAGRRAAMEDGQSATQIEAQNRHTNAHTKLTDDGRFWGVGAGGGRPPHLRTGSMGKTPSSAASAAAPAAAQDATASASILARSLPFLFPFFFFLLRHGLHTLFWPQPQLPHCFLAARLIHIPNVWHPQKIWLSLSH